MATSDSDEKGRVETCERDGGGKRLVERVNTIRGCE